MTHLDIPSIVDCARGLSSPIEAVQAREHLASGCSRCSRLATAVERVMAASAAANSSEPPDHAVRSIKAYFDFARPETSSTREKIRLALGFDTALTPVPVGVRGHQEIVRHISYESGQYLVDLVIEKPDTNPDGLVAGQILSQRGGPIVPLPEVPAFLLSAGELLATALTSHEGGFALQGGLQGDCELWFFLEDERMLGVSWDQKDDGVTSH